MNAVVSQDSNSNQIIIGPLIHTTNNTQIVIGLASAIASPFPSASALIHAWHFEEASGNNRLDAVGSITLNEHSITGPTNVDRGTGKNGFAADFSAGGVASYLNASADSALGKTISVWAYFRSLPSSGKTFTIINGTGGKQIYLDEFGMINGNPQGVGNDDQNVSLALGSLNAWHLIVVTSDADSIRNYNGGNAYIGISIDGMPFTVGDTVGTDFDFLSANIGIVPGDSVHVNALLDEMYQWNYPLSNSDVATLWNSGTGTFY